MTSERRAKAGPRFGRARVPSRRQAPLALRSALGLAPALLAAGALAPAPALGASPLRWSAPSLIDGSGHALNAISCPSESLCVAVDGAGNALTTLDPTALAPTWTSGQIANGQQLSAVSCASLTLCVAVGAGGEASISTNPSAGAASWSHAVIDPEGTLMGVSCPSPSLCVAVDEQGRVLTTTSPGSPGAGWSVSKIDAPANHLQSVSCSGSSSCVAVDGVGGAFGSALPAAGVWHGRAIAPGLALVAVSCSPGGACVAVDAGGDALASQNPSSLNATWSSTPIDAGGHPVAISCDSSGLCVAVDDRGEALAGDNPVAALPSWSGSSADLGVKLTGISCLPGGLCTAVDATGRFLSARVLAPEASTAPPAEVTDTTATLSGVVNPFDAELGVCAFEYGSSVAYGQRVPCSSLPSPAGGRQLVAAALAGLAPNNTYHYRLLAASLAGSGVGADQTFTTGVSSRVPLVFPHPSIRGTPAVGSRLSCQSGTPAGAAQLSFGWLRDLIQIPRASSSSYTVVGADSGHHLQCQVTASDAGGTATARSAFVTIPRQGVVAAAGETVVGNARYRKGAVSVPIRCSSQASGGCRIVIRLTSAGRAAITLGSARARLGRGQRRTVSVPLNATARRLLKSRRRVSAQLTVTGTVIGVLESVLAQRRVLLGAAARHASSHRDAHRS
jgi:hypothetical protein